MPAADSPFKRHPSKVMASTSPSSSYVCDTIPAARLASGSVGDRPTVMNHNDQPQPMTFDNVHIVDEAEMSPKRDLEPISRETTPQPPPRKLCVRHQRMADEGMNLKLQQVSCSWIVDKDDADSPCSRWTSSLSRNGNRSTPYGATFRPRRTHGVHSSSRASSPCAASPSCLCSLSSLPT